MINKLIKETRQSHNRRCAGFHFNKSILILSVKGYINIRHLDSFFNRLFYFSEGWNQFKALPITGFRNGLSIERKSDRNGRPPKRPKSDFP